MPACQLTSMCASAGHASLACIRHAGRATALQAPCLDMYHEFFNLQWFRSHVVVAEISLKLDGCCLVHPCYRNTNGWLSSMISIVIVSWHSHPAVVAARWAVGGW
jgi:hypothetical protein